MPKKAASVVLYRSRPELEVYLVTRSPQLKFFGGYSAFPGGSVEERDRGGRKPGDDGAAFRACAVREVREETGVELAVADLVASGRFVTPRFSSIRFDTQFFVAPCEVSPRVVTGELTDGAWWRPRDALAAWRRSELLPTPPCLMILQELMGVPVEKAAAALQAMPSEFERSDAAISWTPGYEVLPLHCAPLPRDFPTNAFLVGCGRFVAIDPGPTDVLVQAHLFSAVQRRLDRGDRLEAVVLSHHHLDHVGALDEFVASFPAPVWAHQITGELLSRPLDRELQDGDVVELGDDAAGTSGWGLRCLFTPGHAAGHLVFHDERYRAFLAGDLVSTLRSMYVGSPGGHIRTYLASLERIRQLELSILYPSHGLPSLASREVIEETIRHRHERLEEIAAHLGRDGVDVETLAAAVYTDVPEEFRPHARRAARASLEYLTEEGRAVRVADDVYSRAD